MKGRQHLARFIVYIFTCDNSLMGVLKEQYVLSKHANINISESDELAEFERQAFLNFVLEDLRRESEAQDTDPLDN